MIGIGPCPFCGSNDVVMVRGEEDKYDRNICWWISCRSCFASGPVLVLDINVRPSAAEVADESRWNIRSGEAMQ